MNPEDPSIILGIVESEDDDFLKFRTAKKEYTISKKLVISLEDTEQEFMGGNDE